jgi:uncharacterized protein YdaU (DUF1376 family)
MAYLRLIWIYYQTEEPLPDDPKKLAFQIGACPEDARLILEHFFCKDGAFWRHKRCDAEIESYRSRQDHGRKAAQARWKNAKSMPDGYSEDAQSMKKHANREPITDNREPKEKNIRRQAALSCPAEVSEQVWNDFVATRKAARAALTPTALSGIEREAKKAGWTLEAALQECTIRGWRGFKADWVSNKAGSGFMINKQEALEARNKAVGDEWLKKMEREENERI